MKKILLLVPLLMSCSGDMRKSAPPMHDEESFYTGCYVTELAIRGEFHEYIVYKCPSGYAMSHLPNCIYCFSYETQYE